MDFLFRFSPWCSPSNINGSNFGSKPKVEGHKALGIGYFLSYFSSASGSM